MSNNIIIAVSKGRIFRDAMPLLAELDIYPTEASETMCRLILKTNHPDTQIIIVRATDVPTYVEYGAADIGIAGKDVLLEYDGHGLYELLDLKIAQCRMALAEPKSPSHEGNFATEMNFGKARLGRKRIATKYVKTARNYFASQGKQVEIIKLYGSMELAPVLGLADQIVDLIDTGNTLKANGLVEIETITNISSRLIANKSAMKMKSDLIKPIIGKLTEIINAR